MTIGRLRSAVFVAAAGIGVATVAVLGFTPTSWRNPWRTCVPPSTVPCCCPATTPSPSPRGRGTAWAAPVL